MPTIILSAPFVSLLQIQCPLALNTSTLPNSEDAHAPHIRLGTVQTQEWSIDVILSNL